MARAKVGETVLVVDDEPTVRMLVTEAVEDLGYAAIEAADGTSGLKVLFITGYAENAALNHGHLAPGMEILVKPFALEALASLIRSLIEGSP